MNVEKVVVGELETNCYIISKDNKILVVDPGDEIDKILSKIKDNGVVGIIVTHHHFDHIGALEDLVKITNAKIYDFNNLKVGKNIIDNFCFDVIKTPGHKEDAICIYFKEDNIMFSGDFLFKRSIGRWDLEGGNFEDMKSSIEKIMNYDDGIIVYPGHGELTILGNEKVNLEKYLKWF